MVCKNLVRPGKEKHLIVQNPQKNHQAKFKIISNDIKSLEVIH